MIEIIAQFVADHEFDISSQPSTITIASTAAANATTAVTNVAKNVANTASTASTATATVAAILGQLQAIGISSGINSGGIIDGASSSNSARDSTEISGNSDNGIIKIASILL